MLTGQLVVRPKSTTVFDGGDGLMMCRPVGQRRRIRRRDIFWVSAVVDGHNNKQQNHYSVLGVSLSASSSDIKKAYRLLARKWHPDVSKDSGAGEVFKSIHLAYQVLSNKATRVQYDRVLKSGTNTSDPIGRNTYHDFEFEDEIIMNRWNELRQKMRNKSYYRRYESDDEGGETFSSHFHSDKEPEDKAGEERGSFLEILQSVILSLFLMQTVSCQISLLFSSLTAWFDGKLDAGYKMGYLIAWVLGGRAGVWLSLCLSVASWACGKNSSSIVTLVVVAMWVGSNILRYAPLPQGVLLGLLYISVKIQSDLS